MSRKIKNCIYLIACLMFAYWFLVVLGDNGPVLETDSKIFMEPSQYIKQAYPIYTFFLAVCENVFGEARYLYAVHFIQSALTFLVSWLWTDYLKKHFNFNLVFSFLIYICTFLPYGYSLPENVVSHHILTEGLAFPFFALYMLLVTRTFLENKKRYLVAAGVVTIIMFMTRSQMVLMMPVYVVLWMIFFVRNFFEKIDIVHRKILSKVLITAVIVCGGVVFLSIGKVVELSGWNQLTDAVMGRVLCAIDKEDRMLFQEDEQEVFDLLYDTIEHSENRYPHFREGVWKWEDIMDATNENTLMYRETIYTYYLDSGSETAEKDVIRCINSVVSKLFYHHLDDYFMMSMHLFLQSFVVAIFIHPSAIFLLCYYIAILLYLLAIGLLWYANCKIKLDLKYSIPLLFTLLMIVSIVVITNIVFYGLQRYVVYAFGSFYVSCLILVLGLVRERKGRTT